MALVISKGYLLTDSYAQVLPRDNTRKYFELQNKTGAIVYLTVGGSEDDNDAIEIAVKSCFWTSIPLGEEVKMRSLVSGYVTVITDKHGGA